jgi:hypothetical protein
MSNAKKIVERVKEKAPKAPRKKRVKIDPKTVPAIADGVLLAPVGSKILVTRLRHARPHTSSCEIHKIDEDGTIHAWDETLNQWFLFKASDNVDVRFYNAAAAGTAALEG